MGELLRQYVPPLLAWVMFVARRPSEDRARRYVRRILLGLAISLTALTPIGHVVIHWATGSRDLPRLVGHLGMLLTLWAAQDLLLHMNGLRRSTRWHVWFAAAGCVLGLFFALTPNLLPQSPWVFEYVLAYAVALVPAYVNAIRLCLRCARAADTAALRVALRVVVAGTVMAVLYLVSKAVLAASHRFDFAYPLGQSALVSKVLPTSAHVLVLVGATLPALLTWLGRYRRYRRLGPLWRDLYRADPAIALDPPAVPDVLAFRRLRLRLYRRVIEIRDGLLALRPYRDPAVASAAGDRAARAGVHGQRRDAAVEAAVIAAALHAKTAGQPPATTDETAVTGGTDLAGETDFLVLVADAYRTLTPKTLTGQRL